MLTPNLILLYVEDPTKSATFYSTLLDHSPIVVHPTYAAFEFDNGLNLALWSTHAKDFVTAGSGHRMEIAFMVPDTNMVRSLHDRWVSASVEIEQSLHEAVFGLTFVALDLDGHRIRVCIPDA